MHFEWGAIFVLIEMAMDSHDLSSRYDTVIEGCLCSAIARLCSEKDFVEMVRLCGRGRGRNSKVDSNMRSQGHLGFDIRQSHLVFATFFLSL